MDFITISLLIFFITAFFCWNIYSKTSTNFPGPTSLPILGHLYLLGNLPHHSLQQISAKYGPLVKLNFGSTPVLVASSPETAKQILKTNDIAFASRPSLLTGKFILYDSKDMVFAPYGDHWRNMRKFCVLELLTDKRLASSQSIRMEELQNTLGRISTAAEGNNPNPIVVLDYLTEFTFNVITRMVMNKAYFGSGKEDECTTREFIRMQEQGTILLGEFHIGDYIPFLSWFDSSVNQMKKLHKVQDAFLQKVIDEHVARGVDAAGDFVDILLSLPFPDENQKITYIKALIQNLLGAGTDTAITTIQWAMTELLNNPHVLEKAQAELQTKIGGNFIIQENDLPKLDYLRAVIKETFRLHPPAPLLIPHQSTEDCQISGVNISKGTRVFVNVYAIGRDPSLWTSAEEFDPERFLTPDGRDVDVLGRNFELLPFGAGRRGCPGLSLGLITVQLSLANLLHKFKWSLPPGVSKHPMNECFGVVTTMKEPLRAVATKV